MQAISMHSHRGNSDDPFFRDFLRRLQARFAERVGDGVPLFTTDAGDLWGSYLASFPPSTRQSHNCNACHHFIRRYGGLVTIGADGAVLPAFWDPTDAPPEYLEGIEAMRYRVRRAKVTGVFLSADSEFGHYDSCSPWIHYQLVQRPANLFRSKTQSPYQAMAEKLEDFKNVSLALSEVSVANLETAVQLLKSDALYRSEKVLGQAEWLLRLALVRRDTRHAFTNALWLAIATAPAGFCHPRSSMIGTLLEDLSSGMPYARVAARFKEKMSPLTYQRPQAAPKAGAILQAEKLVEQLGIARSLERRFARLEDIQTLWTPAPPRREPDRGGVFGHLKGKAAPSPVNRFFNPPLVMSWAKFARTVLPDAEAIELMVPAHGQFTALVTATHADAPLIFQWDNPVSWYMYVNGSPASRWNLSSNQWAKVTAVALQPSMWSGAPNPHQGEGSIFILEGARDIYSTSLALFPESLKSELHPVRSVIEAHSKAGRISDAENATACGLSFKGGTAPRVRVTHSTNVAVEYTLDRWE